MKFILCFLLVGMLSAQVFIPPIPKKKSSGTVQFIDTLTYVGNGVDDRTVALGGQWDVVMIKGGVSQSNMPLVVRTSSMTGDSTKSMTGASAYYVNGIQSLTATGMVVGTDTTVNGLNITYHVTMMKIKSGTLNVGSYTGNATDNRVLAGFGVNAPNFFITWASNTQKVRIRTSSMANTWDFASDNGSTALIKTLGTVGDTVTLGTAAGANGASVLYNYIVGKYETGKLEGGSYAGDSTVARDVTTATFQPNIGWVFASSTQAKQFKTSTFAAAASAAFSGTLNGSGVISAFHALGITVNNIATVNATGTTYYNIMIKAD